jgi:membrane carboxypeptidase/penicillin-binding protein
MSRIQTIYCYVIQNVTNQEKHVIFDEDYIHQSADMNDEQQKETAFKKKEEYENRYIDEKFRLILREEFETVITE